MGTTSATVETLTAEVRVLMVGRRQVTLSVYRQLDTVEPDEIEPFGRVRDGQDLAYSLPHGEAVYVVGVHQKTGVLVRSNCSRRRFQCGAPDFNEWQQMRRKEQDNWRGMRDRAYTNCLDRHGHGSRGEMENCDRAWRDANLPPPGTSIDEWKSECLEDVPQFPDWSELPLIVLAGLR